MIETGFAICPLCEKRTALQYFRKVGRENLCVVCASKIEGEQAKAANSTRIHNAEMQTTIKAVGLFVAGCLVLVAAGFALYLWLTHRPPKELTAPPATVLGTPPPKYGSPSAGTSVTISLRSDVLFSSGKSVIQPKAESALTEVATQIVRIPGAKAHIIGYTDNKGAEDANLALSLRRAEAVKTWLIGKKSIPAAVVSTEGRGEKEPLAPETNADGSENPEGQQKNRRVTVTISRPYYTPAPPAPAR